MADQYTTSRPNRIHLKSRDPEFDAIASDIVREFVIRRGRPLPMDRLLGFRKHIEIVLLDLANAAISDETQWIGFNRAKRHFIRGGRYWDNKRHRSHLSYRYYLQAIDAMECQGWLIQIVAQAGYSDFSSRMRAAKKLNDRLQNKRLSWASFELDDTFESIIVKDKNKKLCGFPPTLGFDLETALGNLEIFNRNFEKTLINLNVSDEVFLEINRQLRTDLLNEPLDQLGGAIDFSDRYVRRVFGMADFNCGGRFYGGWWQRLPSKYRRYIEIEGLVTVELDFSTLQPRMLYAKVSKEAPSDSYSLPGWPNSLRPLIKKLFSQLLNSDTTSRNPNQWHRFAPVTFFKERDTRSKYTKPQVNKRARKNFQTAFGRPYSELIADLLEMHSSIDELFFSNAWRWTQALDAYIAELVLLRMLSETPKTTALPIHDSFIVRRGSEDILRWGMEKAFEEVVGTKAIIDRDETVYDAPLDPNLEHRLVLGSQVSKSLREEFRTHSEYHKREAQWRKVYGLEGYE